MTDQDTAQILEHVRRLLEAVTDQARQFRELTHAVASLTQAIHEASLRPTLTRGRA